MKNKKVDVAIIGGGPAGLTSAIYASRLGLNTVILEKSAPGGKLNNTHKIDNYPGMEGKAGFELSISFLQQAKNFGSELINKEVLKIENLDSKTEKKITLSGNEIIIAKTIIIATGMKPKKLDVPGYDEFFGKGVSTCVVCDAPFYRGKNIAIVGGGNSATEESLFASKMVNKIDIINVFPTFIAEEITMKQIGETKNISLRPNTKIKEIIGENGKLTSILIEDQNTKKEELLKVEGVFTYIGWNPENNFISDADLIDKDGFVKTNKQYETKFPGVYAVGDILNKPFKQVTIATSEGTIAALEAKKYIDNIQ